MDSKDGVIISNKKAAEEIKTEKPQVTTSANIKPSEGNNAEKDVKYHETDEKAVIEGSSSVNTAESSDATIREKLEAGISADSPSSAVSVKCEEVLCQSRETGAFVGSSIPRMNTEKCFSERKQTPTCDVGTQSSSSPAKTVEQIKAKQNVASTQTLPLACSVQTRDGERTEIEPNVASASGSSGYREHTIDLNLEIDLVGRSQALTASGYPGCKVHSLKTLANQKIVTLADADCTSEIEMVNKDRESDLEPPVLGTDSAGTTCIGKEQTEREDHEDISTREAEAGDNKEEYERKAFFYISSSSAPGMGVGSEWPSVSVGYQTNIERPICRAVRHETREPRQCLGTQRCHYVVVAVALMTSVIGCIVYHLSNSGIGPGVLRPIGASTAFLSFAVCVFSAVYINYLSNYQKSPIMPNYELLGDIESVMAMNRTSNPEFYYQEDGHDNSRGRSAALKYYVRETQSADTLDRRGYGRYSAVSLHSEVKRCSDEPGTSYSTQPQKRFKTESVALVEASEATFSGGLKASQPGNSCQDVEDTKDERASAIPLHSMYVSAEPPTDLQSSDEGVSETSPLLPEKDH